MRSFGRTDFLYAPARAVGSAAVHASNGSQDRVHAPLVYVTAANPSGCLLPGNQQTPADGSILRFSSPFRCCICTNRGGSIEPLRFVFIFAYLLVSHKN